MALKSKIKAWLQKLIFMCKEEKLYPVPHLVDSQKLLAGKIALITGGTSGIGFAMAKAFQESGAKVIITGRSDEKIKNSCAKIGGGIRGIALDVLDVTSMPDKVREAAALFPEKRIDILVNSAGVVVQSDFWHMTESEYDNIMSVNAKGTYFMSRAVAKLMIEKKTKGHILNVTSSSALRPAWSPYQMSKWAVRGLTLGLADLLVSHGIVVNAIAPGPTATPMLGKHEGDTIYNATSPSRRYGLPSELAALAVFMVSDLGNLIVGDTYYMTGGSGTITMHH